MQYGKAGKDCLQPLRRTLMKQPPPAAEAHKRLVQCKPPNWTGCCTTLKQQAAMLCHPPPPAGYRQLRAGCRTLAAGGKLMKPSETATLP
ncbi:MAG: hypothetical protein LBD24_03375 [Spirochaetaceae bacterium]|nr:hypothetical protein [Spirochaetaceae bacterium]